jgi:hypothetical protein
MKRLLVPILTFALVGCGDFVDADGNTSIRQVAEGLQSLGDQLAEMGEALERDADVESVPWADLREVIPESVSGASMLDLEGDDATDRNGAGMSMAAGKYLVDGDSVFVGVADLGALRGGAQLALRWIAPVFARGDFDGDVEEISVDGNPAIRIRDDDDDDVLLALLVEGRFAVIAGSQRGGNEDLLREALDDVDYRQLRRWADYGVR